MDINFDTYEVHDIWYTTVMVTMPNGYYFERGTKAVPAEDFNESKETLLCLEQVWETVHALLEYTEHKADNR